MTPEGAKLNELLRDLGGEPSLCSLVGAASHMYGEGSNDEDKTLSNLARVSIIQYNKITHSYSVLSPKLNRNKSYVT